VFASCNDLDVADELALAVGADRLAAERDRGSREKGERRELKRAAAQRDQG
jgi:hypothetical protein